MTDPRGEPPRHTDAAYDSLLAGASGGESGRTIRLWSLLPRELANVFRPTVRETTNAILAEIQRTVPEYARPLQGEFGAVITTNVQQAIHQFLDRLGDPDAPEDRRRTFRLLGRHEMRHGRSMDVLQTAYRVGARVAWRRMSEIGSRAGLPAQTLYLLAEAVFAYLDELSALSVEGHASAQAYAAGTLERRRRRLLDLVLAEPAASAPAIASLASAAGWAVPEKVVTIALEAPADAGEPVAPRLGEEALLDLEGEAPCVVLPAPREEHRARLEAGLAGWRAAIGPEVPLADAARSLRWARQALLQVKSGALPRKEVTWCEQHLAELWLLSDPFLVQELADRMLAPLAGLSEKRRERLADTLLAWLETRGNVREVAERLSVHPQTVRARVQELETHFGQRLEDPEQRFQLILALRATRLLG
ncbi:PucR family transcriptional regulator [Amycolatopsis anabasis]|uniref:PucR family transcriptional regulator n=1 Tax=Amycolatopsis anabasis TaxID=1840409 RepID=UPI001FE9E2CC|nr:PucR family transcriptional regulator [Amycolatopsis anabasis]